MLILAILVVVSMPVGHATNNVHTFFTSATTVGTCGTLCKGLSTTSGTASTSTAQTSVVEGAVPAVDANANAKKTGTWSSGSTFTIAGESTTTATDEFILLVVTNPDTVTVSSVSTSGITWDAASRTTFTPTSCTIKMTEWRGFSTATISSQTTTITLSTTPTKAVGEIIPFSGTNDPTGTWNPYDKATTLNNGASAASCNTSGTPTVTSTSATLNANDMVIGFYGSQSSKTETIGTGFTLDLTSAAACCSLAMEHKTVTATGTQTCAWGTTDTTWATFCDVLQSAPKYYKVEPETSASLTGIPSTAANGFSGAGWVYDVAGIQNGLSDIQSGTWQIDLTGAVGSTTGTPFARYFVTAWSCPTSSCTTATFLWKNWDTVTNVAGSTTATPRTYTTASQSQITWTSGNFLAFEVWVAWQYSGTTTTTTMTETTISTAMDFITPGWDYAQSLSGSVTSASAFAKMASIFRSLGGLLSSVSSFVEKTSIFKAIAASIALTMGNMVVNVNSGQLTCNSSPRSCSTPLAATWNLGSSAAGRSSLFRSLTGSLSSASGFTERTSVLRALSGAWTMTSGLAEKNSLFRSLTGALSSASGLAEKSSLFRSLTGSLSSASGFTERTSVLRALTGSLGLASSEIKGLARALTGSLSLASGFAEKTSLFRSLSGALTVASGFAEKSSLFRSLSGSLSLT